MLRPVFFLGLLIVLTACGNGGELAGPTNLTETSETMTCPVSSPRDVNIWIDAMPGPNDNPTLIVEFKVTAPTPGYTFTMGYTSIKKTNSSVAKLRFFARAPTEPIIQVETEFDVHLEMPNFYRQDLDGLEMNCDGETFISLDEVATVY